MHSTQAGVQRSSLIAEGNLLYRKRLYEKALNSYTEALSKSEDKTCLAARSRCYLKLGQPENALIDAEASLREDKTFLKGLYQKAEALYFMGKFSLALLFFHRGQEVHPNAQEFRLGAERAKESIENQIPSTFPLKREKNENLPNLKEEILPGGISAIQNRLKGTCKQKIKTTSQPVLKNKTRLGEFKSDKTFLQNVLAKNDFQKRETKAGKRLEDAIQSNLTRLDNFCQVSQFWSQEKPQTQDRMGKVKPNTTINNDNTPKFQENGSMAAFSSAALPPLSVRKGPITAQQTPGSHCPALNTTSMKKPVTAPAVNKPQQMSAKASHTRLPPFTHGVKQRSKNN